MILRKAPFALWNMFNRVLKPGVPWCELGGNRPILPNIHASYPDSFLGTKVLNFSVYTEQIPTEDSTLQSALVRGASDNCD